MLKLDIAENGLRIKIPIWRDKESPTGWSILLGGRHRLEALVALGKEVTTPKGRVPYRSEYFELLPDKTDPLAYVISENMIRRQLTAEQKRNLIAEWLEMCPQGCGPSKINFRNTSPGSSLCERDRLPRLPDSCPLAIWNYSQISSCKSVPPPLRLPLHQPTPLNPALKEFRGRVL